MDLKLSSQPINNVIDVKSKLVDDIQTNLWSVLTTQFQSANTALIQDRNDKLINFYRQELEMFKQYYLTLVGELADIQEQKNAEPQNVPGWENKKKIMLNGKDRIVQFIAIALTPLPFPWNYSMNFMTALTRNWSPYARPGEQLTSATMEAWKLLPAWIKLRFANYFEFDEDDKQKLMTQV